MSVGVAGSTAGNANASLVVDRQVEGGHGGRPAYLAREQTVSYEQLLEAVCRMANLLEALGVRREERVLLVLDDTAVFPAAFLGAMRIGAVPVPVSVREHRQNFRHFVEDSYARVVVCESSLVGTLRSALGGLDVQLLASGAAGEDGESVELEGALAAQPSDREAVVTHPDDMAFWLYTSGSTGRPKGVVHLHRSIPSVCERFGREAFGLTAEDRLFSTTKLYHSYGLGNSFAYPLYFGASAVLLDGPPAPERLLEAMRRHRPTVLCSVPALYRQLLDDPDADGALDSVRLFISAAEPLPVATFERWQERFGKPILDGIGATEMFVTFCSNLPGDVVPGTTGKAIPGYQLRLLDEHGRELTGAAEGALQVRGPSRAACYWHQQERTRQTMPGEWLTTGDRFRRREDGRYVYLGRTDDMLKVGGLWVSPIDMELTLTEHPEVSGAAVVGTQIDDYVRLAAFVETPAGSAPDCGRLGEELRGLCRERLRDHEQPHVIRVVEELPRTLNGKPRRFVLRAQIEQELQSDAEDAGDGREAAPAPQELADMDPAERARVLLELVCRETASLVGSPPGRPIDSSRSFVALGLDSLGAVELRNRLAAATGLRLPSTLAFDQPTPAATAAAVAAQLEGRATTAVASTAAELTELAELDSRRTRTRMPGGNLALRLKTSAIVGALLPARLAVSRAEHVAELNWNFGGKERSKAIGAMRALLGPAAGEDELERLGRAHLIEQLALRALFWQRPWTAQIDEPSSRHLREALASGRGVLLSHCHVGPYQRLDRARPLRARTSYLVPGSWFFETPQNGAWGRRLARWRNATRSRPVRAAGSFRIIQALLERGEAVFLAFDLPGPRPTNFLGKPTTMAEGTAQLAARTGALVVPMRARREGHRALVEAAPPLDPRELAGVDAVHEALAAVHERWILEMPAAMEDPREIGWGEGASPQAWAAPAVREPGRPTVESVQESQKSGAAGSPA
jgi:benzoate-CoA ligase family protein